MNRKLSSFLMVAGTVFTVLFCLVYMARDFTKVINFSNMSDMWSLFVFNDTTGHALFSEVNIDDFVSPPPTPFVATPFLPWADCLQARTTTSVFSEPIRPGDRCSR